ncbi:MAG: dTDP-4-dehydrorhamnose 3,5-epimerase [Oceanipulchritudo sp.]
MVFARTPLEGAWVIDPEPHSDDRGWFARVFCAREFEQIGHQAPFVQINHSYNHRSGTLRGMHFQWPPHGEAKLIRCIAGRIFDVIVDIRKGSETYLQHFALELSAQNRRMLYVPQGFAHGFLTREDRTEVLYHHTEFHTPGGEGGLCYDDPLLAIPWPGKPTVISERDCGFTRMEKSFEGVQLEND